jgi:hypothetical protein
VHRRTQAQSKSAHKTAIGIQSNVAAPLQILDTARDPGIHPCGEMICGNRLGCLQKNAESGCLKLSGGQGPIVDHQQTSKSSQNLLFSGQVKLIGSRERPVTEPVNEDG